ncbi:MAG: ATP-binding cassette domain-containing protein [Planctomycetes bacterium]|nr:ATP-binding cassette domain-containing protein [Planctomycetota bacterium]MCP4772376.1 ATP-binding cassette domain-containing protein [Planctomycetota bacterium]MCP4861524.1 ATP-binding cassette domain-containing protein [Planctomycetota bacterium]
MIKLEGVKKAFGTQQVLDGVDFHVPEGHSLVIMGPSGSGKSVILKHIIGLLNADAGRVSVMGKNVAELDRSGLRELRRDMGYLFQHSALINWLSVFDNLALPLRETTKMSNSEIRARVMHVLDLVQLSAAENKLPSEISGGMQKRVGLARALVTEPNIILYDEPEAGLDPEMSASVSHMMRELKEEHGMTSVTVTHSVSCALTVADTLAVFEKGRFLISGPPTEVLNSKHERVREFLGAQLD